MKKKVIYEKGRKGDELSSFFEKFFNEVNDYNNSHLDKANVVVLSCDSKGGASFLVGDTEKLVIEFLESAGRNKAFRDFLVGVIKSLE